jgi:hypothetical protein
MTSRANDHKNELEGKLRVKREFGGKLNDVLVML